MDELIARPRALQRRRIEVGERDGALVFADLHPDPALRQIRRGNEAIDLTAREFDLVSSRSLRCGR